MLWATFLPTLTILYLILNWLPTLMAAKGFGGSVPAQATMLFNYGSIGGALLFGRFVDRVGARWPLVFSYATLMLCLLALGRVTEAPQALMLSAVTGFLLLGANYALYGIAADYYPKRVRGTRIGRLRQRRPRWLHPGPPVGRHLAQRRHGGRSSHRLHGALCSRSRPCGLHPRPLSAR